MAPREGCSEADGILAGTSLIVFSTLIKCVLSLFSRAALFRSNCGTMVVALVVVKRFGGEVIRIRYTSTTTKKGGKRT